MLQSLMILTVALVPPTVAMEPRVQVLETGRLAERDVPRDAEGRWWALCTDGGRDALVPVEVGVKWERAPEPGEGRQARVEARGCEQVVVLVRGVGEARTRELPVARHRVVMEERGSGERGEDLVRRVEEVLFGEQRFRLQTSRWSWGEGPELRAWSGHSSWLGQHLHPEADWALRWAGDLDGDGRLDLVVDEERPGEAPRVHLFLSSSARGRELVGEVDAPPLEDE